MQLEEQFLPPSDAIEIEPLRDAVRAYEQAAASAREAAQEATRVERGRAEADRQDAEDLAAALEQNKPAPKPRHVQKHEQDLGDARRRAAATQLVRGRRWTDLEAAFREHGAELTEDTARRFEAERARYLAALEEFAERHRALGQAFVMRAFVEADGATARYRPGAVYASVHQIRIPPVEQQDGGGVNVATIVGLLAACGEVPEPAPTLA
jgi:hypothetical protein